MSDQDENTTTTEELEASDLSLEEQYEQMKTERQELQAIAEAVSRYTTNKLERERSRAAPASVVEAAREWITARDALFELLHEHGILDDPRYAAPHIMDSVWTDDVDAYEALLAALAAEPKGVGE